MELSLSADSAAILKLSLAFVNAADSMLLVTFFCPSTYTYYRAGLRKTGNEIIAMLECDGLNAAAETLSM